MGNPKSEVRGQTSEGRGSEDSVLERLQRRKRSSDKDKEIKEMEKIRSAWGNPAAAVTFAVLLGVGVARGGRPGNRWLKSEVRGPQ